MIPDGRENLFEFHFPKTFMPKEISDKYRKYLNRIPGNIIEEPLDFLNYTIQSITIPGMGYDPVIQDSTRGSTKRWRSSLATNSLFEKELTITFQLTDGYINYWMMMDLLNYYYRFDNDVPYLDNLNVRMLDNEGNSIITARIIKPLLTNISELSMSFASNVADFTTFDITIAYNNFEILIELD